MADNNIFVKKAKSALVGNILIAADKSISHRSLIFSALANGKNTISNLLESEDVLDTAKALQQMGVNIQKKDSGTYEVIGSGISGLTEPENTLDLGNSGTGVRLLMGLVTPFKFKSFFTGDESLRSRPMKRIFDPMRQIGAKIIARKEDFLPAVIEGSDEALAINYKMPKASAQIKSSILLAALNIVGKTTIIEPDICRDHTEIMMQYLGLNLEIENLATNGRKISYQGVQEFQSKDLSVPNDISSAAFFIVGALVIPDSRIELKNIGINKLRDGIIETLLEMGADIEIINKRENAGELVADIKVRYSNLRGVEVPANRVAKMIDEYPILAIAAAHATGVTKMNNLSELKAKESNRLSAIYKNITKCGIKAKMGDDDLEIVGGIMSLDNIPKITTHHDHRIAMSFFILGLTMKNGIEIDDTSMISTSFPNFLNLFQSVR
ncbi:MAG: 3-phosphoshikimate 1-carboxyvinyltransferase [Rickettsiales bacterium]|jgi:3-phosphoshikimate 1-carboxyvinyltransferase